MPRTSVTSDVVRRLRIQTTALGSVLAAAAVCGAIIASNASAAISVSAGGASSCALALKKSTDTAGQVFCWGAGSHGRLGRNLANDNGSAIPALVPDLKTNAIQVDVGQSHACALLADRTAKCWGSDAVGQLGIGHPEITGTGGVIAKAGATSIAALTLTGAPLVGQSIRITGTESSTYFSPGTTITAITGGGPSPYTLTLSKPSLRGGSSLSVSILDTDSTSDRIVPAPVTGLSGITQVSAGYGHSCAVLNTGRVYCWGDNSNGQLGRGSKISSTFPVEVSGINSAISVNAGYIHSCAVLSDGTAKCWGSNVSGQLGDGTSKNRTAPVSVKTADPNGGDPITLTGIAKVVAGYGHSCALMVDKTVSCWGSNYFTQLGDPAITDPYTTVAGLVPGLTDIADVDTSYLHSCAITTGKKTYCWGHNTQGDTGITVGTAGDPLVPDPAVAKPTLVPNLADATSVVTGNGYTCVLLAKIAPAKSGTMSCWGFGGNGQRGDNTTAKSLVPIAVWGGADIDVAPPPIPQIMVRPLLVTKDRNARFTFMSVDPTGTPVTYNYAIDGAAFISTSLNGVAFTKLKPGPHKLVVTATDIWGNVSSSQFYSWTIV